MTRIPIEDQVMAVARMVDHLAARGTDAVALAQLEGALASLKWLRDNQVGLRLCAGTLADVLKDPGVRAVLDTWPGAELVGLRLPQEARR